MSAGIIGKVPLWLGRSLDEINLRSNGKVDLLLEGADGSRDMLGFDHVIFATGYKTDVTRLRFLEPEIVARMRLIGKAPRLSSHFESSIPGLHFIGPLAANSFGPVCRFVFGARFPARHLARYLPAVLGRRPTPIIAGHAIDSVGLP